MLTLHRKHLGLFLTYGVLGNVINWHVLNGCLLWSVTGPIVLSVWMVNYISSRYSRTHIFPVWPGGRTMKIFHEGKMEDIVLYTSVCVCVLINRH